MTKLAVIKSTSLSQVGFEQNTLIVQFKTGVFYAFQDVPEALFKRFMKAKSFGKFFQEFIKNKFQYKIIPVLQK